MNITSLYVLMTYLVNVAYGMWADQSTDAGAAFGAGNAVDGFPGVCAITDNEAMPWWQVRITAMNVVAVDVTNRADCCEGMKKE